MNVNAKLFIITSIRGASTCGIEEKKKKPSGETKYTNCGAIISQRPPSECPTEGYIMIETNYVE